MQATQDMEWNGVFRTSLQMTLPEPQRSENPIPGKCISIMDLPPIGQINKSKMKLCLK